LLEYLLLHPFHSTVTRYASRSSGIPEAVSKRGPASLPDNKRFMLDRILGRQPSPLSSIETKIPPAKDEPAHERPSDEHARSGYISPIDAYLCGCEFILQAAQKA
jgi:hypothetical protein